MKRPCKASLTEKFIAVVGKYLYLKHQINHKNQPQNVSPVSSPESQNSFLFEDSNETINNTVILFSFQFSMSVLNLLLVNTLRERSFIKKAENWIFLEYKGFFKYKKGNRKISFEL